MRIVKFLLPALLLTVFFSSLSSAATPDRISGPIDPTKLVELKGHVSPMARAEFDQGPVEPSRALHVTMLFLPTAAQQEALNKLLAEQQDIKSPNFHKWLTPKQYGERFGLSQGDLDKISAWLAGAGFKVTYVANGRDFLSFDGVASQVDSVFKTEIHYFNVNGKMHVANTKPPSIPAALSGIVGGFRGLHDFTPRPMHKLKPDYTISGVHFLAPGDLATIYDTNKLYQLSPAIDGTGQKIVIAGQSDVYLADLHDYRTAFGISDITGCTTDSATHTILQAGACSSGNLDVVWADGTDPGLSPGDLSESDLDIEVVSAVAGGRAGSTGVEIIFVSSPAPPAAGGVDDSTAYAIDNKLAPVISYSYGLCEALNTAPSPAAQDALYQQAAGEGISFFAASGDAASAECDFDNGNTASPAVLGPSVSYPASSAYVTGVGGTEFDEGTVSYWGTTNGSDGGSATSHIPETAWNDTGIALVGKDFVGTGGGPSNCANNTGAPFNLVGPNSYMATCNTSTDTPPGGFAKPTWQSGITPSDNARDVPDLSFSGSNVNDPYIVCAPQSEVVKGSASSTSTCVNGIGNALTQYNSAFGGTSASTPLAASMTVLLNQYLKASGGLGLINTTLYKLYSANPTGVFNDIQSGTNSVTEGASNNIVPCTNGDPKFEPTADQCPTPGLATGTMGYSVAGGHAYSEVTGVGSLDIYNFIQAWAASEISFTTSATPLSPASVPAGNSTTSTVTVTAKSTYTYTFSCSGLTGASCSFKPSTLTGNGSTTMTITTLPDMAPGSYQVTVTATAGGVPESASALSLTVTATTESYTLTASNPTYSVTAGSTATVTINVGSTSTPPFVTGTAPNQVTVEPVVYTCTGYPSESTCTGPVSGATTATSVTFTIMTTAPSAKLQRPFDRGARIFYAALLPGLLGIVFTFGSRRRSLAGMRILGLIMVLGFSTVWLGSCGGNNSSSSNPGTPQGSYTITINAATTGANPLKSSTTFTLQVQ